MIHTNFIQFIRDEISELIQVAEQVLHQKQKRKKKLLKSATDFSQHFDKKIVSLSKVILITHLDSFLNF